jgi:hypothetical protein
MGLSTAACAGLMNQPSSVRPPTHPLLGASTWFGGQQSHGPIQSNRQNESSQVGKYQRLIQMNIAKLNARVFPDNRSSINLLRAVYAETPIRKRLGRVRSLHEVRALGTIPDGPLRAGDVVFFKQFDTTPGLAIVKGYRHDGRVVAIAPLRGRLREIQLHLKQRATRRSRGMIINSFIRIRKPGDPARSSYLAGELVSGLRRLMPSDL